MPIPSPSSSSFKPMPIILRSFRSESKHSALNSSTSCNRSRHFRQQLCGNLEPSACISISDTRQKASANSPNSRNMVLLSNGLAQTRHRAWASPQEDIVF
uniref:(northern house mosquito) hypothetical protein n=1 Tax=Culex pipiens TaxID=7175 RepID=A0A8D8DKJ3_CULPI